MLRRTTLLIAAFSLPAGRALAQASLTPPTAPRVPPQPGQGPAAADVRALQRADQISAAQVEAGEMAAGKAAMPALRQLGSTIAADHGRFRHAISGLAGARRVELPERAAEDLSLASLRDASGEAFDRAFLSRQLGLYRPMAELYQAMASNSPDPAIARFGITALAAARAHFDAARELGAPLGLRAETVENPPQY
jgi:predicted outer membrane protein